MRVNVALKSPPIFTHEGGKATPTDPFQQLKRSVLTCLLWEDSFYEGGDSIAQRIKTLVPQVKPEQVAALACEARDRMQLRHVPLFLVRELARGKGNGSLVADTLAHVIQRADELAEFLAIYWKDGRCALSAGVKRGLAAAFVKFNEYQLAKYNQGGAVKLRDVLFLCHAKPKDADQAALWKRLVDGSIATPDTWEVALSAGKDKKETFERLMREGKLGGLATLRNLRNMQQAGVDQDVIRERLASGCGRALPFRFFEAAKHVPKLEDAIENAMFASVAQVSKLQGSTLLVVDVSGSMGGQISRKSDSTRLDVAAALAVLCREICEFPTIYATAGNDGAREHATVEVPARRGFGLAAAVVGTRHKIGHGGIFLVQCLDAIEKMEHRKEFDRVIVLTDEQDCDIKATPQAAVRMGRFNYIVNVAVEKNGIGYQHGWHHIDGWSEQVFDYIREFEAEDGQA